MNTSSNSDLDLYDRAIDVDRILYEMREAVAEAIESHRRAGNPIAIWRDGRVVWIPAEEIPVRPQSTPSDLS